MTSEALPAPDAQPTRVLVVDDSATVRALLSRRLNADPAIEVVGTASDGLEALERIAELRPDVVTLDIEMPRLDGLATLERIMQGVPDEEVEQMCFRTATELYGVDLSKLPAEAR